MVKQYNGEMAKLWCAARTPSTGGNTFFLGFSAPSTMVNPSFLGFEAPSFLVAAVKMDFF